MPQTTPALVKIQLSHWAGSPNYLEAEHFTTQTSYGKVFDRYRVVARYTWIASQNQFAKSDSLKGVTYSAGEVIILTE